MTKKVMTGSYVDYANDKKLVGFNFYTNLRKTEKASFVNTVTDTLIGLNYSHILRDMIFDFQIICMFTDVDVTEIVEAPNSLIRIEDLLEDTNIVDIVKANAEEGLIDELNKAVDLNIEYRTGIHRNGFEEALTKLINTIEKKINDVDTSSMMELAEKLSVVSGDITPERIVEAYSKTDAFKNNMDEVEKAKKVRTQIIESAMDKVVKG